MTFTISIPSVILGSVLTLAAIFVIFVALSYIKYESNKRRKIKQRHSKK